MSPDRPRRADVSTFSLADMVASGRELRIAADGARRFDEAAGCIVRWLYDHLVGPDGERACVLVRCFRTHRLGDLDPERRAIADAQLGDEEHDDAVRCLVLSATAGHEEDWNDPARSAAHRVLTLPSEEVVERSPMISQLLGQFGVDIAHLTARHVDAGGDDPTTFEVFHVEEARDSPHVPDQEGFVVPYGIRSVLGFGAPLTDGELFAVLLFSRVRIPREVIARFEPLALHARLALLPTLERAPGDTSSDELELVAVRDLLDLHERVVSHQAEALEERAATLRRLAEAAAEVHEARDVETVLGRLAAQARRVVPARRAYVSLTEDEDLAHPIEVADTDDDTGTDTDDAPPERAAVPRPPRPVDRPMRLTRRQLARDPAWAGLFGGGRGEVPVRGWLAAPIVTRDGHNIGLLQVAERSEGDFTQQDEHALVQLAKLGSLAIENVRLAEAEALARGERFREELLAGISHDMKTPLVAVVGLAESLADDETLTPQHRDRIREALVRQARSLQNLVLQFLDYTRLEAGRRLNVLPQPTHVGGVVARVTDLFGHLRRIRVDIPDDLPAVLADEQRLQQVVANLLSNAVKFSSPDSEIAVTVRREPTVVALAVRDQGTGLRPDEVHHLFQKFYRADNAAGVSGSGLGLYVSRLLVESMGGTIDLDTEPGIGSTFVVRLPLADDRAGGAGR